MLSVACEKETEEKPERRNSANFID